MLDVLKSRWSAAVDNERGSFPIVVVFIIMMTILLFGVSAQAVSSVQVSRAVEKGFMLDSGLLSLHARVAAEVSEGTLTTPEGVDELVGSFVSPVAGWTYSTESVMSDGTLQVRFSVTREGAAERVLAKDYTIVSAAEPVRTVGRIVNFTDSGEPMWEE